MMQLTPFVVLFLFAAGMASTASQNNGTIFHLGFFDWNQPHFVFNAFAPLDPTESTPQQHGDTTLNNPKPSCPRDLLLNDSKCTPEDASWPPCEYIHTSYFVRKSSSGQQCFHGVGEISKLIATLEEKDASNNTISTYSLYDVLDFDLPLRNELEYDIVNSTINFNFTICPEEVIGLIQSCGIASGNSSDCLGSVYAMYADAPNQFQPVSFNGSNYVYFNESFIDPQEWENVTTYTVNETEMDFEVTRTFYLCGTEVSIMDCEAIITESFYVTFEENATLLVFSNTYIYPEDYVLFPNGSALICWKTEDGGTSIPQQLSLYQVIISHVAFGLSILFLFATLFTYCALKPLRNFQGLSIMNFTVALLMGQLLLEFPASYVSPWPIACQVIAAVSHFFFLAAFAWMTVIAFNLYRRFSSPIVDAKQARFEMKSLFRRSCVIGWLAPGTFMSICTIVHLWGGDVVTLHYGGRSCWIYPFISNVVAFFIPLSFSLSLNAIYFILTIRAIKSSKGNSNLLTKSKRINTKDELIIYVKISSLMGFGWCFGFVAALVQSPAIYCVFSVMSSAQGILVFWSFGANSRVRKMWRERSARKREKQTPLTVTEHNTTHTNTSDSRV